MGPSVSGGGDSLLQGSVFNFEAKFSDARGSISVTICCLVFLPSRVSHTSSRENPEVKAKRDTFKVKSFVFFVS